MSHQKQINPVLKMFFKIFLGTYLVLVILFYFPNLLHISDTNYNLSVLLPGLLFSVPLISSLIALPISLLYAGQTKIAKYIAFALLLVLAYLLYKVITYVLGFEAFNH